MLIMSAWLNKQTDVGVFDEIITWNWTCRHSHSSPPMQECLLPACRNSTPDLSSSLCFCSGMEGRKNPVNDFFLPSCFLGNGKQVGAERWKSVLNGGLVSHPDGSQVYFALVLHLIMGASVTGFSSGGRRRKMRHGPWAKQTKSLLSIASAL